jgi:small subunit ribosomal protein S20
MRTAVKKARAAVSAKEKDADALVKEAVSEVYRAAAKSVIPKNTASRTVGRLMKAGK